MRLIIKTIRCCSLFINLYMIFCQNINKNEKYLTKKIKLFIYKTLNSDVSPYKE